MEVGAEVGQGRQPAAEVLGHRSGFQGTQPHPQPRDRPAHRLDQVRQSRPAGKVPAVAGQLNAGDHNLLIARRLQGLRLGHGPLRGQGPHRPSGVGDDAVGTEIGAPILHLQHAPGTALQPSRREGLKPRSVEGVVQGHRLFPLGGHLLDQIQKGPPVPAAADEVSLQFLGRLGGDLGIAAAQRHQGLRGPFPRLADGLAGLLVAGGSHRAAVDEIHIRLVGKRHQVVAPGQKQGLHGLALVLVHFAPQGI